MRLSAEKIHKSFGSTLVLDAVNLYCNRGEIVGLLGVNGAGKSTLFKILMGLVRPDLGKVNGRAEGSKVLGGIIEKPALYEYLSAAENLKLFGKIQGAPVGQQDIVAYLERVGLSPERKDRVANYSMGMKQRLAIAIALLNNPPFLVLDEPFSGLDPMGVVQLRSLILELVTKQNIGVLISSHLVDEMIRTCDRIYVINKGRIIREDTPHALVEMATGSYVINGEDLSVSKVLKQSDALVQGHTARVKNPAGGIGVLLKKLAEEQVTVFSCVPETDIKVLLDASNE